LQTQGPFLFFKLASCDYFSRNGVIPSVSFFNQKYMRTTSNTDHWNFYSQPRIANLVRMAKFQGSRTWPGLLRYSNVVVQQQNS
jgi:hypothetical protein